MTTNLWPTGGFAKAYVDGIEQATFATALQGAGYRTALFGKYLNGYPFKTEPTYIPPGWDEWWAPITDTAYGSYGYQVNHNGQIEDYGFGPEDYITDVMAQRAVAFITNTTTLSPTTPFFLALNVYTPHSPAAPPRVTWACLPMPKLHKPPRSTKRTSATSRPLSSLPRS